MPGFGTRLDPALGYSFRHEQLDYGEKYPRLYVEVIDRNGNLHGWAYFKRKGAALFSTEVLVLREHRRKGIASAIYSYAEKVSGRRIVPSKDQTAEGKLFSRGRKRQMEGYEESETVAGQLFRQGRHKGFGMARRTRKPSDKLRDQERPVVMGRELNRDTLTPKKQYIDTSAPGDWGRDPIGDGLFRMVPSGDVVDYEESERRLRKKPLGRFGRIDVTKNFRRERKRAPSSCAPGSFRAKKTKNGALLTFCCAKGQWDRKRKVCRTSMKLQSIGRPRRRRH